MIKKHTHTQIQKTYEIKNFTSLIDNFNVYYYKDFIPKKLADRYLSTFERKLKLHHSNVIVNGKEYTIGRKSTAYGEPGISRYANSWDTKNDPVCQIIRNIRKKVELFTRQKFNFVVINRYADGNDSIGYHRDRELKDSPIVGVTLGAEREFSFIPAFFIPKKMPTRLDIILHHGSIYALNTPTNEHWKHGVPKRANVRSPRISLTFRQIQKDSDLHEEP